MAPPWTRMKSFVQTVIGTTPQTDNTFTKAPKGHLFPQTTPSIDGQDCLHDCTTCTVKYPSKFEIDTTDELYGHVKGWSRHVIVATGKTDWVRDVADEKGSVMEAVGRHDGLVEGKLMLSASDIPTPGDHVGYEGETSVILLPAFVVVEGVTPATVPDLIKEVINSAPTNASLISPPTPAPSDQTTTTRTTSNDPSIQPTGPTIPPPISPTFKTHPCPHNYLILLCSQKTRDARCGQSAPLLRKELERHLRPLGLYRDLHDERPGGVGIYFISHVGGHKYSANVMVYRRAGMVGTMVDGGDNASGGASDGAGEVSKEAAQCIWLARIRPEDCENIIRYTVLQGKVVKPESQLRGGFDRSRGLSSW